MDLERSLASMVIDDGPWRDSPQGWSSGAAAGPSTAAAGWGGHVSPATPQGNHRNVWQDSSQLAQNVNEALGLGGASTTWSTAGGGASEDFNAVKNIWQPDGHLDGAPHFGGPSAHQQRVGANGMVDGMPSEFMRHDGNAALWDMGSNNPMKQQGDHFWNKSGGEASSATWAPPNGGRGGWPQNGPQMPAHMRNQPPPPGAPMGRPPNVSGMQGNGGAWPPNSMVGGPGGVGPKQGMWEPPRMRQMPGGGGGPQPRRYPDVTVPPPVDIPGFQNMSIRGGGPPQPQMWKDAMGGGGGSHGSSGMRNQPFPAAEQFAIGDFGGPFMTSGKPASGGSGGNGGGSMGHFSIGATTDDLMWHDPNGELKKWQRDTGVSVWGEPDKAAMRNIRYWQVAECLEEDLEHALMKCPVPQKRAEDGTLRLPLQVPPRREIIETGWGDLPLNDPNKSDDQRCAEASLMNDQSWFQHQMPQSQQPFTQDMTWQAPPGPPSAATELIAENLRIAVERNFLDVANVSLKQLPTTVLPQINALVAKIPDLVAVEKDMADLVEASRPEGGEVSKNSPQRHMNDIQKMEYDRLIIQVTTLRIELGEMGKKIKRQLIEAGIAPAIDPIPPQQQDPYYSFLD